MSKSSGGVASAGSIEDASLRMARVNVRASTEGHKWRGKRLNHDKYICEMEKIA